MTKSKGLVRTGTPAGSDCKNRQQAMPVLNDEQEGTRSAADNVKSAFPAEMSHEIRTYLNTILNLAQLLEKKSLLPDQNSIVQRISIAGQSLLGILNVKRIPATPRSEQEESGSRLAGRRVLVVDDSKLNRIVVTQGLVQEGATAESAGNGEEALNYLRERPGEFDIVLMDVQMPVMDGLTATRTLRNELGLADLPVIALSAGGKEKERQKVLDAGLNDFLLKPVNMEEMVGILLRWLPPPQGGDKSPPPEEATNDRESPMRQLTPALDIARGIAIMNNNEAIYRELIGELVRIHGDDAARIRGAVFAGNLHKAAEMAHALKGVAGNLAADGVFLAAHELEGALLRDQHELVDRYLLRLTDALTELRNVTLLIKKDPTLQKRGPLCSLPRPEELSPLMEELMRLLSHRCMDALDVMAQLGERLTGTVAAAEAALLRKAVNRLEFDAAQVMAQRLAYQLTGLAHQLPQQKL